MRQRLFAALMIFPLLLAACGASGDEAKVTAFCDTLQNQTVSCEAEILSRIGGESETFALSCAESEQGSEITLRAPETLSGVTAHVGADASLSFDGLVIPVPAEGLSPLSAVPTLLNALRRGHLDLVWREGDTLTAQFIQNDDLAVRVYFSPDGLPAAASFLDRGAETITCTITQWTQSEKENSDEPDDSNLGGDQSQHPGA